MSVNTNPLNVYTGGGTRKVTEFSQINEHHDGSSYTRRTVDGKPEKFRGNLLAKDLVLKDSKGNANVGVPSGVSGYVRKVPAKDSGGFGNMVEIRNEKGELVGRFAHLKNFDNNLKEGSYIARGTILGVQGTTGKSTGVHLHAEMSVKDWKNYIRDLQSGKFSDQVSSNETTASSGTTEASSASISGNESSESATSADSLTTSTADTSRSLTEEQRGVVSAITSKIYMETKNNKSTKEAVRSAIKDVQEKYPEFAKEGKNLEFIQGAVAIAVEQSQSSTKTASQEKGLGERQLA